MTRTEVHIVPDAIFGLRLERTDGAAVQSFVFLEVDRGSMTIAPGPRVSEGEGFLYRATILRKLLAYAESWARGSHRDRFGMPTVRTLFLTTSSARAEAMRSASERVLRAQPQLPPGIFLFGSMGESEPPLDRTFVNSDGRLAGLLPRQ